MFEVIPAIDLLGGKCVRLSQGVYDKKTIYSSDPLEVAKKWESLGAPRLHLVDLDGAKTGIPENIAIIKQIIKSVSIPVQVGGGIRNTNLIEELLNCGAERTILSTSAISNPNLLNSMCPRFGDHLIISIDVKQGKVALRGWKQISKIDPLELAKEAVGLGIKRFIYTDISRDGMLTGPNIAAITNFANAVNAPVIAAGGISSKDDVEKLRGLSSSGIEGCIIGKALYAGKIKLEEVL